MFQIPHAELAAILDPTGDKYGTYVPFVYDSRDFDWCDGFDAWWTDSADDDFQDDDISV